MSRIGKNPVEIPSGVDVSKTADQITVKGPKGTLTQTLNPEDTESVSAISSSGIGVWRTWRRLIQCVFEGADTQRLTRAGLHG